jgi:hypothetical protein
MVSEFSWICEKDFFLTAESAEGAEEDGKRRCKMEGEGLMSIAIIKVVCSRF